QEKMPNAIFAIYLDTAEETRILRMALRGDNREQIEKRIINDRHFFDKEKINVDYIIKNENTSLEKLADTIYEIYIKNLK
ncbi:MAG: hypothetical protein PHD85_00505, partial [Bacilli bacterium]|nr:hypothetical protein [Bacilli bacterium]